MIVPRRSLGIEPAPRKAGSVASLAVATYASILLGVVTGPIVARALGPSARGEYASILVYSTIVTLTLTLGVSVAVTHFATRRLSSSEHLVGASLRLAALTMPAGVGLAWVLDVTVFADYSAAVRTWAFVFIGLSSAGVLAFCLQSLLLAQGDLRRFTIVRTTPLILTAAGVLVLAPLGELTLVNYLIVTVVVSVAGWLVTWRAVDLRPAFDGPLKPLVRFGARAYPGSMAGILNGQLDQAILAGMARPAQLGYYAIAVTVASLPDGLAQAIAARAAGNLTDEGGRLNRGNAERYIRQTMSSGLMLTLGLAVSGPFVVPLLYSEAFDPVVIPMLLLLPGSMAIALTNIAGVCLNVIGRPGITSWAQGASLVITAVGLALLLPPFGIQAAAAVSSVAYIVRAAIQLRAIRREGIRAVVPGRADFRELARALLRTVRLARS